MKLEGQYMFDGNAKDTVYLNGDYITKVFSNKALKEKYPDKYPEDIYDCNYGFLSCKNIFVKGKIFYNKDTPKIEEYIQMLLHSTFRDISDEYAVNKAVAKTTQQRFGTICPTEDLLFEYENKLFYVYGRYIYAYDTYGKVVLNKIKDAPTENSNNDDSDEDHYDESAEDEEEPEYNFSKKEGENVSDDESEPESSDQIAIQDVKIYYCGDHFYAIKIVDKDSKKLEAFGIYG